MTCQIRQKSRVYFRFRCARCAPRANINSWISKPLRLGEFEQTARPNRTRTAASGGPRLRSFRPGANDETAADACSTPRVPGDFARHRARRKRMPLEMAWQHLIGVKQEIQGFVEIDLVPAQ